MASKTKSVGKNLTEGPVFPLLITFAAPMILTSIIQQVYSMVDLMIIGKFVGSIGTVGVSTGGELSDVMTPLASAFATAGQIYIAQIVGAKDRQKLRSVIGTLLTLMMVTSIVITAASLIFHNQFLNWLNCPEEAFTAARNYLVITTIGMPFIFGYNAICAILRGMGESKRPLIFIIVAAVVNVFLDLLLVVIFHLEESGTAIATVASQIGAFAAALVYMYKRREQIGIEFKWSYFRINKYDFFVILKLGIPQLVRVFCVQSSLLWVKSNVNAYGLTVSAAYSVGNKIEKFMNLFIQGLDGAGGAMIGQNLGARKHKRVNEIIIKMLLSSLVIGAICGTLFLTIPGPLYAIFTNDPEVIDYGAIFLRIMALGCIVVSFSGSFKSIATGAGAALLSLILGILDAVCRILICLVTANVLKLGAPAYFWGAALCQLIPGLTAMCYFLSGKWKTKKLLTER